MSFPSHDPNYVYRDFVTNGVPSSGTWDPHKPEIRRLLKEHEAAIIALIGGQGGDIVLSRGVIYFNVTGGTADAIIAEADADLPENSGSAIFILGGIAQPNTGPITINGKPLRTNSGNDIVPGGLVAGGILLFLDTGSDYRLLSDQASASIVAAAEGWAIEAGLRADNADAAADRAESYAAMQSADKIKFATVPLLLADELMSYTDEPGKTHVGPADVIEAGGFRYEIAAPDAPDYHVETVGGVRLNVLPTAQGIPVDAFGARGDGQRGWFRVSILSGSSTLSVLSGAPFKSTDVGKLIIVSGAGASGGDLITTIAGYTNTATVTLSDSAGTTLTNSETLVRWGTDDYAAIQRALWIAIDGREISGAVTIGAGSAALHLAGGTFTRADIGKTIRVPGAGATASLSLITSIVAVADAENVTLAASAGTAVSGVTKLVRYTSGRVRPLVFSGVNYFLSQRLTGLAATGLRGVTLQGAARGTSLTFTQSGRGIEVDAFAPGAADDPFIRFYMHDLLIEGHSTTTDNIYCHGVSFSKLTGIDVREGGPTTGIAYHFRGCMSNILELKCSVNNVNKTASRPSEGMRMSAGTRAGVNIGSSTNNTLLRPMFDGLQVGWRLTDADQNTFVGGASQSQVVYGLLIGQNCRFNLFLGTGFENLNSTADIADNGTGTRYIDVYSSHKTIIQALSRDVKFDGGYHELIEVAAGAYGASVEGVLFGNWFTGVGGFHNSGTATRWKNLRGLAFTASFNGTEMTVSAMVQTRANLNVGDTIRGVGIPAGVTIAALGTGTGKTGTYTLSASVGVLASRHVRTDNAFHPQHGRKVISGLSGTSHTWMNNTGLPVELSIYGGTVSLIKYFRDADGWDIASTSGTGLSSVSFKKIRVDPSDSVLVQYSVAPTMTYTTVNES